MEKVYKVYCNYSSFHTKVGTLDAVCEAIDRAGKILEQKVEMIGVGSRNHSTYSENLSLKENTINAISESDLVITVISQDHNVLYEMGLTLGFGKPSLFIANQAAEFPSDLHDFSYILYKEGNAREIIDRLSQIIANTLKSPENYNANLRKKDSVKNIKKIFVSYSHVDNKYLDRLKVHIKPLERNNLVELWSDTLIMSGEKWKQKIEKALNEASIAILFISADFIASDFIINNELQPLLKNAENKGTVILPIIVKPCRFLREPNLSQFQAINNPIKPLCKLDEYEQEEIYELVSQRIEIALQNIK